MRPLPLPREEDRYDALCRRAFYLSLVACAGLVVLSLAFAWHVDPSATAKAAEIVTEKGR